MVQGIERERTHQPHPSRRAPLAVAVDDLDSPGSRQVPARPLEVGARRSGMGREGRAAQRLDVVEGVARVPREAEDGVVHAEAQHVTRGRGDLRPHDDEHAVVVALPFLRVQVVVVGDHDELQPGRACGRDHLVRSGRPVRQRGVHMDDPGHPLVPVMRLFPDDRKRPPPHDVDAPHEHDEKDDDEDDGADPLAPHGIEWDRWLIRRVALVVCAAGVRASPGAGPVSVHSPAGRPTPERARAPALRGVNKFQRARASPRRRRPRPQAARRRESPLTLLWPTATSAGNPEAHRLCPCAPR